MPRSTPTLKVRFGYSLLLFPLGGYLSTPSVLSFSFPGSKEKGTLKVQATKRDGMWRIQSCTLDLHGKNRKIPIDLDLRAHEQ